MKIGASNPSYLAWLNFLKINLRRYCKSPKRVNNENDINFCRKPFLSKTFFASAVQNQGFIMKNHFLLKKNVDASMFHIKNILPQRLKNLPASVNLQP